MIKTVVILLVVLVASQASVIPGGWLSHSSVTDKDLEIARWSSSQLSASTGIEGEHTVLRIKNLRTQVVSGINYKFTLDVLIAGPENKYYFRSCEVAVNEQPWLNQKTFLETPKCVADPQYPDF